ncbi:MAG: hypothetical protein WCK11_03725 [Candidatus Falkowbacteria bacterium]
MVPGSETCQILSFAENRSHEIMLTEIAVASPNNFGCDLIHELCHAHLCEKVDSNFATLGFCDRLNIMSKTHPQQFMQIYDQLGLIWAHVDIWVDDVVFYHWPRMFIVDHQRWSNMILRSIFDGQITLNRKAIVALAMQQANRQRHHIDAMDLFAKLIEVGVVIDPTVATLAKFYESLPKLTMQAGKDLKTLEASMAKAANLLGFSIKPKLVKEAGRWLWDVT